MPQKKQVPTLVDLALRSVEEFLTTMTKLIRTTSETNPKYGQVSFFDRKKHAPKKNTKEDQNAGKEVSAYASGSSVTTAMAKPIFMILETHRKCEQAKLHSMLEFMKHLSNSIPLHLHDKISIAVLTAIVNLFKEKRRSIYNSKLACTVKMTGGYRVALQLIEVAVGAHLKAIQFSVWPGIMQDILFKKLYGMVGLEILDLGSELVKWKRSDIEETIASGVSAMPNLICFILHYNCTDNIILALAKNCKKLQKLDVTHSICVSERSVGPLLSCKHLRYVNLDETCMTILGYANLFLQHLKIEDIGRCDKFGDVLEHIHKNDIGIKYSLHIRKLETRIISMKHLHLLTDMCPYITCLYSECNHSFIGDLSILATLDYLKELELTLYDFYAHGIKTLLEMKGCAIISLHLELVQDIDLNALILISQYCPDIRDLVFDHCKFLEHAALHPRKLAFQPFQYLERIECDAECANVHLEFLLSHCINIKSIELGELTEIGDDTTRRILLQNPMSKLEVLKILNGPDLTMETVQLLMQNCDNLRHLSKLETWGGISSKELNIFREDLKTTNTNLDTSSHNGTVAD